MALRAGFAQVDITPPIGTLKIGWIIRIVSDSVLDPLFARAAVLESGGERIALISLDTLCIRWTEVVEIRRRIEAEYGFPGDSVMIAATHNHAGPAVRGSSETPRDEAYVATLVGKVVEMFGRAIGGMREAKLGVGWGFEFRVAHNRRVIMRDGTVKTHGQFDEPDALCLEGPIDPEVAVLAARSADDEPLGAIVNFSCHPTHHGGTGELSAGFPGALASEMKQRGWPITVFLNGASGNLHSADPARGGAQMTQEQIGATLAEDVEKIVAGMEFRDTVRLAARARTIQLPFRRVTEDEIRGTVRGAQRFNDPGAYDRTMPFLLERIGAQGTQPAQVQALDVDEVCCVSIPGEFFVQNGLKIKERAHPRHALIVSNANGRIGYIPHAEAFPRGGYETTFGDHSRLAPEAGDLLVDCAIGLIARAHES